MASMSNPMPEPKGSVPSVRAEPLAGDGLNFNERHALQEARSLLEQLSNGEGSKRGEFCELIARRIGASGEELSIQLRPIKPREVSGGRERVLEALDSLSSSTAPTGRGLGLERYDFTGYPVIALVTEGLGSGGTTLVGLHTGLFKGQDASIALPQSKLDKTIVDDVLLGPTSGTALIDVHPVAKPGLLGQIQSFDGKLTATLTRHIDGAISLEFSGDPKLAEIPVWFAFVDRSTDRALEGVRNDGGRGQGMVYLSEDGRPTAFEKTFTVNSPARLIFALGRPD